MTLRQYQGLKLLIVAVLAAVFARSVALNAYLPPIAALIVAWLALLLLRRRVKEVVADERDWQTGGRAALHAMQIYAWITVVAMLVLFANRDRDPAFETVAVVLAYATCVLMLLYAFLFRYFQKAVSRGVKTKYVIFILALAAVLAVAGIRFFAGEGAWSCVKGQWIRQGRPSRPMPDAAGIDGTPYFFHDGPSGLEVSYPESWRDLTWIEADRTRSYREIRFHHKAAGGGRPLLLKLTIYPDDVGNDVEPWLDQDVVLRNERYVVTAVRPTADEYALGEQDRAVFARLEAEARSVVAALRFRQSAVGQCSTHPPDACPAECVICPPCPECSSISCQSAEACRAMDIGRGWYEQITGRAAALNRYRTDGQAISWEEAVDLVNRCLVEKLWQTHARKVGLVLVTGRRLETEEPRIDDVIDLAAAAEGECGRIQVGTE